MISEKKVVSLEPLDEKERQILNLVDDHKENLIQLVQNLVKIQSVNPSEEIYQDRSEITNFIAQLMTKNGFDVKKYDVPFDPNNNQKPLAYSNLIISTGQEKGQKRLQFQGHIDTVPISNEKWISNIQPFDATILDGKLYGRGTADMKGGIACLIMAMQLLKQAKVDLNGKLQLWLTPDEETHGKYGSAYMTKNHLDIVNCDATIIAEATGVKPLHSPTIVIGEKGPTWVRLTFFGASGHGSMPKQKSNTVNKATRFMTEINKIKFPKIKPPMKILDSLKNLLTRYKTPDLLKLLKKSKSDTNPYDEDGVSLGSMFKTTVSFDKIEAGSKVNVIPDKCVLEMDIRALPKITTQAILHSIVDYCTKLGYRIEIPSGYTNPQKTNTEIQKRPVDIELAIITRGDGSFEEKNTPTDKIISNAFEAIYSVKAVHFFSSGFTDAGYMREAGIKDVFVLGPAGDNVHSANEYVDLESLVSITKLYMLIAYRYLCK